MIRRFGKGGTHAIEPRNCHLSGSFWQPAPLNRWQCLRIGSGQRFRQQQKIELVIFIVVSIIMRPLLVGAQAIDDIFEPRLFQRNYSALRY